MEEAFNKAEWNFMNMNSPADLFCHYLEDGTIYLEEYDRCRNGHLLLSSFFVDAASCEFETEILDIQDGAGIGLYFGDGCFDRYILAVVGNGMMELRIPNGVPLGDTFRYDGPKRWFTAASAPFTRKTPFRLGIASSDAGFSVTCDGKTVIGHTVIAVPWRKPYARLAVMAVNDRGTSPKAGTAMGKYRVQGVEHGVRMAGICVDGAGRPLSQVWLHAAGIQGHDGLTDETGCFDLGCLPVGEYEMIGGAEGKGFCHFLVEHGITACFASEDREGHETEYETEYVLKGQEDGAYRWCLEPYWQQDSREAVPQGEITNDCFLTSLNGVWKFSLDPLEIGEKEKWYLPDGHIYEQRIRIPGSWQSLRAFGEEFLADDYSLHQASAFRCNWREQGRTAWMQTTISVENDTRVQLVLGAVSGIAKVWLEEKEIGCTVDFYSPCRFRLGRLKADRSYTLTVKVLYPFEGDQCCFGKQGFWFTDSPGIWQNVWLEEERKVRISDILVDNYCREDNGIRFCGRVEAEVNPEIMSEVRTISSERSDTEPRSWNFTWDTESDILYRLDFVYLAPKGRAEAVLEFGETSLLMEFDATYGDGYDRLTVYARSAGMSERARLVNSAGYLEILRVTAGPVELNDTLELKLHIPREDVMAEIVEPLTVNSRGILEASFEIAGKGLAEWGPEAPNRYLLSASVYGKDGFQGTYERWTAFRRVGQKTVKDGTAYVTVNGKPVYLRGVLDQGYNPWGIYTYPSLTGGEPGSVSFDVRAAGECGYNMIRMHIKDNEPDWYTACDREGILVWDEIPSCFYGTWKDPLWRGLHLRRMKAMAKKQNYHSSVVMCSVFNESWGILGDHERSPWDNGEAQAWIRTSARIYKKLAPGILVVDNSGYGKTGETDILDYHSYPIEFADAMDFFGRLEEQNYPGSVFNCYNEKNRRLMKKDVVADLLQRNCRNPLKETEFTGNDCQRGQPVMISEFVHTNEIERLVRICRFAGYVRMNLISQENEDTSPFTSRRTRRDFGFMHGDMTPAGYDQANQADFIFLARPWLTEVRAGTLIKVPVYAGIRGREPEGKKLRVCWSLAGVDYLGHWKRELAGGEVTMKVPWLETGDPGQIEVKIPEGIKGAWLFAWITDGAATLCEHDVQFEVEEEETEEEETDPAVFYWNPAKPDREMFSGFTGRLVTDKRRVWWASGSGRVTWHIQVPENFCGSRILRLEMSSCECLEGTRLTDEKRYPSEVRIYVQGKLCGEFLLPDQPWDKRALFSNARAMEEGSVSYRRTGTYGYGFRYDIPVELEENTELVIETDDGGCIIYGNRMGRYGCDPMFLDGENEIEENHND